MGENDAELVDMLGEIDEDGVGLNDWEIGFVADLIDNEVSNFTAAQAEKIREIYKTRVL